jgi:hypothetical protein
MRDDRRGATPQYCGKGVDIGARQGRGSDRDVVISDAMRFRDAPCLGGGSCPGSSPSGRLLMIVRTPAPASASISARSSRPATLSPGANGNSWGDMPVLRDCRSR